MYTINHRHNQPITIISASRNRRHNQPITIVSDSRNWRSAGSNDLREAIQNQNLLISPECQDFLEKILKNQSTRKNLTKMIGASILNSIPRYLALSSDTFDDDIYQDNNLRTVNRFSTLNHNHTNDQANNWIRYFFAERLYTGSIDNTVIYHQINYNSQTHDQNTHKPSFIFATETRLTFDFEKNDFWYVCEQIKLSKGCSFIFDTIHHNTIAYGDGATRQVYSKLCNDLIGTLLIKTHPYFMDINVDHPFWQDDENIECFVMFIAMVIKYGCLLPYHLPPALLESITNKKLQKTQLEFFMKRFDSVTYYSMQKVSPDEFPSLDIDFETHEDYYKHTIIGTISQEKMNIYQSIAKHFELFDSYNDYDILVLDETFSGIYTITPDHILPIINFKHENYNALWENFVRSLSECELKQMLILFGNTCSLNNRYTIIVREMPKLDLEISVCFKIIILNERLFENVDKLDKLRIYFEANDQISDHVMNNIVPYSSPVRHEIPNIVPNAPSGNEHLYNFLDSYASYTRGTQVNPAGGTYMEPIQIMSRSRRRRFGRSTDEQNYPRSEHQGSVPYVLVSPPNNTNNAEQLPTLE